MWGLGVCASARVSAAPRHSWLGCWGLCVLGACSACAPPFLAGVCGVGVCVWARFVAAPRLSWLGCWGVRVCVRALLVPRPSWLGCAVWLCMLGLGFRLRPATPGWGVGVYVCVCVRAPLVPRHSWLGYAVWVGVLGLWFPLRPASPGWGVGVCVCVCVLAPLVPRHSWLGCACLGSGFGCAPPLLAGASECVRVCVRSPLVPRHSWLGCLCFRSGFGCAPQLRAGVSGCVCACVRAPLVPRYSWLGFVVCGFGVAWHLSLCRGSLRVVRAAPVCGTRWPLLLGTCPCALVVAGGVPLCRAWWPGSDAPHLVRSGRSLCSGRLSRRRGAVPHAGGLRPRLYWVAAWGTRRPAENRALCACRWPPLIRGRWARSASYPFGAARWGCPWRVPPASVLGCVRCGGWRLWTQSLTRPVSRTVCLSTGDSAGAPGLFRVDADTPPFGSEDATPGSRACVRVRVPLGRVGRAGLPGALWCASPFPMAGLAALFVCSASSGLGSAFFFFCAPWLSLAFLVFGPGLPALGVLPHPPPPPPLFVSLSPFFFFLVRPRCLLCSVFSCPGCLGPWRVLVSPSPPFFFFLFFCFSSVLFFLIPWLFFFAPPFRVFRAGVPWTLVPCCRLRPPPCCFFLPVCFLLFVFFPRLCLAGGAVRALRVCPGLWGVLVCALVVLSLSLLFVRCSLAPLALAGVVWCCHVLGCLLLGLAVLHCLLVGPGVLFWWCCPCLAAWLAALWFGVVCLGVPLPCVVLCGAVLSCGGVLSCSGVCLRRGLCLLFVSCRWASVVCVLGSRAVRSLSSAPCAVLCCAVLVPLCCAVRVVCAISGAWCFWFLLSLCVFGGPLVALVAWCCRLVVYDGLGIRVWPRLPSLGVFPAVSCSPVLCPVALCCRVVLCCGALSSFFPFFLALLVALVVCFPQNISCKTRKNGSPFENKLKLYSTQPTRENQHHIQLTDLRATRPPPLRCCRKYSEVFFPYLKL